MEEGEWATETLKATGRIVATTLIICPQGDWYGKVTPQEAAVRIAKAGKLANLPSDSRSIRGQTGFAHRVSVS